MTKKTRSSLLQGKVNTDQLAELSFILFFCDALIRILFQKILGDGTVSSLISMLVPYIPLVIICIRQPQKYIKLDFIILFLCVLAFFAVTLLIHPDYEQYYERATYGVWDHVLKPYRGIYAYIFIRLIGDPKRILKCMRISGWVLMVYFIRRAALGNWNTVGATGVNTEASYSVTFGYEVLIFALVFLHFALTERKAPDIIAAAVDIIMIVIAGSRGPILFIGLFIVLFFLTKTQNSKKKWPVLALIVLLFGLAYYLYTPMLLLAAKILDKFHLSSRFVRMTLSGTITSDSNRLVIWEAALQMIKDKPWGYGAMGSRHVIYHYNYAGYPHSIILEFLIDYGVLFGGLFLILLFGYALSILFSPRKREWSGVFLPFFCAGCSMFISLTYWSRPEFWSCLALGVCCHLSSRRKKKTGQAIGRAD